MKEGEEKGVAYVGGLKFSLFSFSSLIRLDRDGME